MATIDISMIVKAVNDASSNLRQVRDDVEGIGTSADRVSNQLRAIQVVMAGIVINKAVELGKTFIENAVAIDNVRNRMVVAVGTFKEADSIIESINKKFEATTANTDGLTDAFVRLVQSGLKPDKAREVVDAIGKLSLLSKDSKSAIEEMSTALVKMFARGGVDMRSFASGFQQVPLAIGLMAKSAGVSFQEDFVDLVKSGAFTVDQIVSLLAKSTGRNFDTMIAAQKNTISGSFSLITNALTDSLRAIQDTPINTAIVERFKAVRAAIDGFVDGLKNANPATIEKFFGALDNGATTVSHLVTGLTPLAELLGIVAAGAAKLLSVIPPEALTIGLFAYLFVGKAGAVVFTAVATAASLLISNFATSTEQVTSRISSYLPFGVVGLALWGPAGAAVGIAAASVLDALITKIGDWGVAWQGVGTKANAAWKAARDQGQTFSDMLRNNASAASQTAASSLNAVTTAMNNVNKGSTSGDVFELIKKHAQDAGLTINQTAALIAHAKAESDLGQNLVGDKGHSFGLFQFNDKGELPGLMQFADKAGKSWLDFGTQVDYVIQRAGNAQGKLGDMWKAAASPEQASLALNEFERFKGYQDPLNSQVQTRISLTQQYTRALIEQSAAALKDSAAPSSGSISAEQLRALTAQADTLGGKTEIVTSQFQKMAATLNGNIGAEKLADVNRQMGELTKNTMEDLKSVDDLIKKYQNIPGTTDAVAKLTEQHNRLTEVLKGQNDIWERQKSNAETLGSLTQTRLALEQQSLQLRAQQAQIDLKVNFNNDPVANLVKGTSAGQIINQVLQQQTQLQQNIVNYDLQINQLEQQRLTASASQAAIIDQTISKYQSLRSNTQAALSNLSAEGVAANQLWQAVGNTIENTVVNGLSGLITHTMTLKQAGVQAFNAITQAAVKYLFQLMVIKSFGSGGMFSGIGNFLGGGGLMGGLMAANGAIVPSGVKMFANGGIIGGPTLFGMAGEAGTEAIMPLERVGGKLGVRTVGATGDTHIHLSAIDTQSGVEFLLKNTQNIQNMLAQRSKLNRGLKGQV